MPDALPLTDLPLFPLRTVLFPGGVLQLRIFEVRYLDMIAKCHKAGEPFGVVLLIQGSEVRKPQTDQSSRDGFAAEAFHVMGTLARITELSTQQPGLMMIRCSGTQRFEISSHRKLSYGLWVASAAPMAEDMRVSIPRDLQKTALALGQLIKSLQQREVRIAQMPLLPPYRLDDCGWVANRWCELLPIHIELKQQLMQLDNPLLRLELVSDILERSGISS